VLTGAGLKAKTCLAFLLFALLLSPTLSQAQNKRVLILKTGVLYPFEQAITAFKKGLQDGHIPTEYAEQNLNQNADRVLEASRQFNADLIFAVGSPAAKFAQERFPETPIVFSMVLYPALSNIGSKPQTPQVTGVAMDVPLDRQFQMISQVVPNAKVIGVIYNPNETGRIIAQANDVCKQMSLELLAIPVKSTGEVPRALDGLEEKIDVLWSVADATVFNGKMPEYILQYTLQHNIPFMGLSTNFVEAGALFGL